MKLLTYIKDNHNLSYQNIKYRISSLNITVKKIEVKGKSGKFSAVSLRDFHRILNYSKPSKLDSWIFLNDLSEELEIDYEEVNQAALDLDLKINIKSKGGREKRISPGDCQLLKIELEKREEMKGIDPFPSNLELGLYQRINNDYDPRNFRNIKRSKL